MRTHKASKLLKQLTPERLLSVIKTLEFVNQVIIDAFENADDKKHGEYYGILSQIKAQVMYMHGRIIQDTEEVSLSRQIEEWLQSSD